MIAVCLLSIFLIIPFGLQYLGFDILSALGFSILLVGLFSDALLTRLALKKGLKESNILYGLVKNRISSNNFIIISTILGISLGVILLLFIDAPFLILMIALLSLIGSFGNAMTLSMTRSP